MLCYKKYSSPPQYTMNQLQSRESGVTVKLFETPLAAETANPVILCVLLDVSISTTRSQA